MKTIAEFKGLLKVEDSERRNTILGMQLHQLIAPKSYDSSIDLSIHNLEEKIELIVWMSRHGLDVFTQQYQLGTISWAYHTWQSEKLESFRIK